MEKKKKFRREEWIPFYTVGGRSWQAAKSPLATRIPLNGFCVTGSAAEVIWTVGEIPPWRQGFHRAKVNSHEVRRIWLDCRRNITWQDSIEWNLRDKRCNSTYFSNQQFFTECQRSRRCNTPAVLILSTGVPYSHSRRTTTKCIK